MEAFLATLLATCYYGMIRTALFPFQAGFQLYAVATASSGAVTDVPSWSVGMGRVLRAQGEDQSYIYNARSRISRSAFLSLSRKGHGGWKSLTVLVVHSVR
ncbi:uncharacterized protein BDV17DRAFT_254498 [Aspergillus undulatus]|uniref:uncharacterized protein n=1 Tax=Aspergillus undulatus TaxID=1810928 RepID=UPI003CCE3998